MFHFSDFVLTPTGAFLVAEPKAPNADGMVPKPRFVTAESPLGKAILAAQKESQS